MARTYFRPRGPNPWISHQGVEYQAGDDGWVTVDDDAVASIFRDGGFVEKGAILSAETADATRWLVSGKRGRRYPIEQFGTVERARKFSTAQMTVGYPAMTIPGYTFSTDDIGKTVGVKGPGVGTDTSDFAVIANDGVLVATILSVSGDTAVLSVAATQSASGCQCIIGRPIDAAMAAATAQCLADYAVDGIAGTVSIPGGAFVACNSQPVTSGFGCNGARRDATHVYVVKITANADDAVQSAWIRRAGGTSRYSSIHITQLSLIGTFMACSGIYAADMKMIHMDTTDASSVTWCRIVDNPSTALGYDKSFDCELAHNLIIRGGRLCRPSLSGSSGGAGGSAIGIAVGDYDISMHVHHNRIRGSLAAGMGNTAAGATGRSGINIEASAETPNPPAFGGNGLIIEANIIEGYYNGIVDSGSLGSRIVNNVVRNCVHGIKSGSNGVTYGRMARDTLIAHNDISNLFPWGGQYAIGIAVNSAPGATAAAQSGIALVYGRTRIVNNTIRKVAGGNGIALIANAGRPLLGVVMDNNTVADCDWSGIRLIGEIINLQFTNNTLISNGRALVAGNKAPIRMDTGTTWTGGYFYGNSYLDPESTPTQDAAPSVNNAVLTNVWAADKVLALINGTYANLPAAAAAYKGFRATINDASVAYTTANIGSTAVGGGSNTAPVFCNGTNWVIG